jgi:RimJ/RimL family protein N-acetyltransferase
LIPIKVEVNGYNRRAIRVCERLRFRSVGRVSGAIVLNGNRYDQVIMDLLREEYDMKHVARFKTLEESAGS